MKWGDCKRKTEEKPVGSGQLPGDLLLDRSNRYCVSGDSHGLRPRNDTGIKGGWVMTGCALLCNVRSNTPSGSQRPVGRFYSTAVKQNPSDPRCQRRLAAKKPPLPKQGRWVMTGCALLCSVQYAERKPATGRAVLLDCRQAKSIRLEMPPGASPDYMSKGSMPRTGWPFSDR